MASSEPNISKYEELTSCLEILSSDMKCAKKAEENDTLPYFEKANKLIKDLLQTESQISQSSIYTVSLESLKHTTAWQKEAVCSLRLMKRNPSTSNPSKLQGPEGDSAESMEQLLESMRLKTSKVGLSDVAGLIEAKQLLKDAVILPIKFPHLFTGGRQPWNSVLLYGPPGTGKTHLAHAVAGEISAEFYVVTPADLLSSWFGNTEKNIRNLFRGLKERSQSQSCIVFIDEIDGLCRTRTNREQEHTRRMKTELLGQLQDSNKGDCRLFFLCATNCPWEIDVAFLRRFQRRIYIPLPDRASRISIMQSHCGGTGVAMTDADWEQLLDCTDGFSGSDLSDLTKSALYQPLREVGSASHWIPGYGGKWMPCLPTTTGAIRGNLMSFPPNSVCTRDVTLQDFLAATCNTRPTVSQEDLDQYTAFTNHFGQIG